MAPSTLFMRISMLPSSRACSIRSILHAATNSLRVALSRSTSRWGRLWSDSSAASSTNAGWSEGSLAWRSCCRCRPPRSCASSRDTVPLAGGDTMGMHRGRMESTGRGSGRGCVAGAQTMTQWTSCSVRPTTQWTSPSLVRACAVENTGTHDPPNSWHRTLTTPFESLAASRPPSVKPSHVSVAPGRMGSTPPWRRVWCGTLRSMYSSFCPPAAVGSPAWNTTASWRADPAMVTTGPGSAVMYVCTPEALKMRRRLPEVAHATQSFPTATACTFSPSGISACQSLLAAQLSKGRYMIVDWFSPRAGPPYTTPSDPSAPMVKPK
mmetsp:Transcript_29557/g.94816  ORF Transcript_29557/g.94816 Transcript_29557/m.94816 type:complete len:323 (+) Transcript_29557:386-1354(+)